MSNRRKFIKQVSAAGLLSMVPDILFSNQNIFSSRQTPANNKMWGCLLHLSFNMWEEYIAPEREARGYRPDLRVSDTLWSEARKKMANAGMNMVLIDLGDAIQYKSHPEIAVNQAWSRSRLKEELAKFRTMGIEPIPKLNFSTGHDTWLGKYSRMVSTPEYYAVCRDLIAEVIDLFDKPRFFHLGMDEEDAEHQRFYQYIVVRQKDLWWKDFYFLVGEVEKRGCRPWIWSDKIWHHPEEFLKKMPKSVLQSNWYYRKTFDDAQLPQLKAYTDLEAYGYDQVPTGSSYYPDIQENMLGNVQYCAKHIADTRLFGFLQTLWVPTIAENRELILKGIELTGVAKKWYDTNRK
jgi:hypothetical protein